MVVFDEEEDGRFPHGGEVERFVEFAGAGAAVADNRQAEDLFAAAPRRPNAADHKAEHLSQVTDHGEPPRGGVAMMDVALAAVREAVGVGHVLAKQLVGSRSEEKMGAEVAMQQRHHVPSRTKRHCRAKGRRLVARADRHRPLHVALLEQLQNPLLQPPRETHERVDGEMERLAGEPFRPTGQSRDLPMLRIDPQHRRAAGGRGEQPNRIGRRALPPKVAGRCVHWK